MSARRVVLLTYGEPPAPKLADQLAYSRRILTGLTRTVAPFPGWMVPAVALWRATRRTRLWQREGYSSPLEAITRAEAGRLGVALAAHAPEHAWRVHVGFEFRAPLVVDVLDRLPPGDPVDVLPLYVAESSFTHQLARRTVAAWERERAAGRSAPVRVLPALDVETLAELEAQHVLAWLAERSIAAGADWALVLAAHGTLLDPPPGLMTGREATERLAAALARRLAPRFGKVLLGWLNHARGGRWTQPTVAEALRQAAAAGLGHVAYFPFGFLADNAETELEGRLWLGTQPALETVHLPCLNDSTALAAALARLVTEVDLVPETGSPSAAPAS